MYSENVHAKSEYKSSQQQFWNFNISPEYIIIYHHLFLNEHKFWDEDTFVSLSRIYLLHNCTP